MWQLAKISRGECLLLADFVAEFGDERSKDRLGVEARFWLPRAPLGAAGLKQLH
jgi:hypothetical protein